MTPKKKPEQPDYPGLVALLPTLHYLVDAGGTVTLEPDEAEHVRSLGFHAQAGLWRVPPLPAHLVAGNPLLEPLGNDVDMFWRSRSRQAESKSSRQATEIVEQNGVESVALATSAGETPNPATEPLETRNPTEWNKESAAILSALARAGGTIERRKLQKKLWRIKAQQFNGALESLRRHGLIQVDGNLVVQSPDHADSALFHGVPPAQETVTQVESALGLTGAPDQVNGIRGVLTQNAARKVIEDGNR